MHVHVGTHTHMRVLYVYTHVCVHACAHTNKHTQVHAHAHTHTHTRTELLHDVFEWSIVVCTLLLQCSVQLI